MKVLKIAALIWKNASRDKRELSVAKSLGAEIAVMARSETTARREVIDGYDAYLYPTRPFGNSRLLYQPGRAVSFIQWAKYAAKMQPEVISGHDLPGLGIGWLSTLFLPKKLRPRLIYDSHEFEMGRTDERSKFASWAVLHLERFLIRRCDFTICYSGYVADQVQRIHGLKERPVVARNIPPYWELDEKAAKDTRAQIIKQLGLPDDTFLTMYHGMLSQVRGVEDLIRATALTTGTAAVILGDGDDGYRARLRDMCRELGVENRVLFIPAVPHSELRRYIGAVDVGIIAMHPLVSNSLSSLPNKLFENIQGGTPVIASDMPAQQELIEQYDIGAIFESENIEALASEIMALSRDRQRYARYKHNLVRAKEELCWEHEQLELRAAYEKIFAKAQEQREG